LDCCLIRIFLLISNPQLNEDYHMQHILKTFENNTNSNLSILDFEVISLMDEANLSIIEQSDLGMQILKKMNTLREFKKAKEMLYSAFHNICLTWYDIKNVKVNNERAIRIKLIDALGIVHQFHFNSDGLRFDLTQAS